MTQTPPPPPPPPAGPPPGSIYPTTPATARVRTNGLAITSLVTGIAGICCVVVAPVVAVVTGHLAMEQVADSGGAQKGRGMAVAGAVLGWVWLGLVALVLAILVIAMLAA